MRRKRSDTGPNQDRLHACAIVQLGQAWRSHQEGDVVGAVRHLVRASQCISSLIERWTAEREAVVK